jgi:succinate dehydrogenase / fumarate reductase flavoprotein subunit
MQPTTSARRSAGRAERRGQIGADRKLQRGFRPGELTGFRLSDVRLCTAVCHSKLAGEGAAEYIRKLPAQPAVQDTQVTTAVRKATDILNRETGANPYLLHDKLCESMAKGVGIVWVKEELETAIAEIERLKKEGETLKAPGASQYHPGWHEALAMRSLLVTSEAVARCALMREESRGAHTRLDHPGESKEWVNFNCVVKRGSEGAMQIEKRPKPPGPPALVEMANAKIEDLESEVGAQVK